MPGSAGLAALFILVVKLMAPLVPVTLLRMYSTLKIPKTLARMKPPAANIDTNCLLPRTMVLVVVLTSELPEDVSPGSLFLMRNNFNYVLPISKFTMI